MVNKEKHIFIKLNGAEIEVASDKSIKFLVEEKCKNPDHVVVELNQEIIKQADWEMTILKNNDQLELIAFVGGG
ncbi:sulfur carrier protein ThiS [Candidatus Margulisiibacteriota bacterium]